jgi:hypothetical protein
MEVGTKSLEGVNAKHAYATSFGMLPDRTRYAGYDTDTKNVADLRPNLNERLQIGMKALGTTAGGAGTAGYALIPIYVDPQIVDRSRKYTPLTEIVPRVTNQGITADYNIITAKGGAFFALEDAALGETSTTYDRASTSIKYLYAVGRVTGQALAAVPSYMLAGFQPSGSVGGFGESSAPNAMQLEVLVKARELKEAEEDAIINGDAVTNPEEYSGIVVLQSTTNKVDKNTTALNLDDVTTAIQYAFDDGGRPNFAVCSSAVYGDLLNLLQAKIGFMQPTQNVFWGFSTIVLHTMVGDVPVVPSMFMSNVTGSKSIYFLDLSVWEMRVLMDMTYEKFGKLNDSDKFFLKIYEALICRATGFNAWIGEIA